ncbi:hypothetical protein [Limnoglobus roseus]|uniref:SMI1/KNR4 family protein n=1 Tax=Limnoglobus roseus TaxID=2598579 RepID=A0A5C1ABJ4_9BACT|nr:hypothetical protein [Limnoglobus roseus]QEL15955.1 hypothetical protein PX52LOC_02892 [Limnoglobus roseus]
MTEEQFLTWVNDRGLPRDRGMELLRLAATPEEMKAASEAWEPPPPIYNLGSIVTLTEDDPLGVSPKAHGFLIVGSCPNGDLIAVDGSTDVGSVWFVCHETMREKPLREVALRVADNLADLMHKWATGKGPMDYFDAERVKSS